EHAQLIGPEATAARASDLESVVEFLDPIFDVAASAVHLFVDEARRWPKRRDDESRIVPRVSPPKPHDFGFDHDSPWVGPLPRAPRVAGALPGRRIAAHRYCSASSLNVTNASSGR